MDQSLRDHATLLLAETLSRIRREGDAGEPRARKHEEWLAAEDHHEGSYVGLATLEEDRALHIPLDKHLFEAGNLLWFSGRNRLENTSLFVR